MEPSPSEEVACRLATQGFPNIFWNPKVYYRIQKSLLLIPTLSQINPVHTVQSYLSKIHFNIFSVYVFLLFSFFLPFQPKFYVHFSSQPCALYALPILSSLTSSFYLYLAKSTSYEAPQYEVLLLLLLVGWD
jgi:hypothetical protein